MSWTVENPGRAKPGENVGDLDEFGRELLDDRSIPDLIEAPNFGRWRGGLIHPDRPRFMISEREHHSGQCVGGWVRSVDWWGLCPHCHNNRGAS